MLADRGEKCLPATVRMPLELMIDTSIPDATRGPETTPPWATPAKATPAKATPARAAADALHGLWAVAGAAFRAAAGAAFRAVAGLELSTVFCVYVALLVLALLLEPWSELFEDG